MGSKADRLLRQGLQYQNPPIGTDFRRLGLYSLNQ
jgi:hypothetical protein